jgi:hypothetical protein
MSRSPTIMLVCASMFGSACIVGEDAANTSSQNSGATCESWEVDNSTHTIWPPNHKLYRYSLDSCVTISDSECPPDPGPDSPPPPDPGPDLTPPPPPLDPIDPPDPGLDKPTHLYSAPVPEVRLTITSISSNEPIDVSRGGDGNTTDFDARIVDDTHFELRAERQGIGKSRIYTVNFVDQSGETGACTFVVPHDNGSCVN